jgi:glycolate oxidase iron-sulfur subunit
MARALAEGHLEVTASFVEHQSNCLVCDACSAICPAGVHMDPLQVVLRAAIEPRRARPRWQRLVRGFVFGWLFTDLGHFRTLVRLLWL